MREVDDIDPDSWGECRPVDRRVAEVAERQHGVVTRRQLLELGIGRRAIEHRVAVGRLHVVHRGVYLVGHRLQPASSRWMAGVLGCGDDALLSYRAAAAQHLLLPTNSPRIDVTVPRPIRGPAGIVVHRTRLLHAEDRAEVDGIPVTSVARTLVDIAGVVYRRQLERAVETAERLAVFDLALVERVLERSRGRRGAAALRDVTGTYREPPFTRSEFERRMFDLTRNAGLPEPAVNKWIAGGEADLVWDEQRLVVELDSSTFHNVRAAFERDRMRDAALQLAGYRVLRVTDGRLEREPAAVVAGIAALLNRGR
jgi:very-short-patch-repair endonuclease